jgi:hypothetical protein
VCHGRESPGDARAALFTPARAGKKLPIRNFFSKENADRRFLCPHRQSKSGRTATFGVNAEFQNATLASFFKNGR